MKHLFRRGNASAPVRAAAGRTRIRVHVLGLVTVATVLLAMVGPAGAQASGILEIPLRTVVRTEPGVQTVLASLPVSAELVGQECLVESHAENNSSIHPGNDIVVSSGTDSVVLVDVEGSNGKITTATSTVTLGDTVTATLIMGPDGVFSAGASAFVVLECFVPATTTTTTTTTSTTTTTTTVPVSPVSVVSTTTAAPTTTIAGPVFVSVPPAPPPPPILAVTGVGETAVLFVAGLVLLDLGYLTFSARRPATRRSRET